MEHKNLNEHLKHVHEQRKANTCKKVDEAVKSLIRAKKSINFNSVAKAAGVSKATLYNHSDIRERIDALRNQQKCVPSIKELKKEKEEKSKMAIISSLKRKIRYLEAENEELRDLLKTVMYDEYKKC